MASKTYRKTGTRRGIIKRVNNRKREAFRLPDIYQNLPPVLGVDEEYEAFRDLEKSRDGLRSVLVRHPLIIDFYARAYRDLTVGSKNDVSRYINIKRAAELLYPSALKPVSKAEHEEKKKKYGKKLGTLTRYEKSKKGPRHKLNTKIEKNIKVRFLKDLKSIAPLIEKMQSLWSNDVKRRSDGSVDPYCEAYQEYIDTIEEIAKVIDRYPLRRKHQRPLEEKIAQVGAAIDDSCLRSAGAFNTVSQHRRVGNTLPDDQAIGRLEASLRLASSTVSEEQHRLERNRGDIVAAEQSMIHRNIRLVVAVAKSYAVDNEEFSDYIDQGVLGLAKALELFQFRTRNKFSTYATWWVAQAIEREIQVRTGLPNKSARIIGAVYGICCELGFDIGGEVDAQAVLDQIVAKDINLIDVKRTLDYFVTKQFSYNRNIGDDDAEFQTLLGDKGQSSKDSFKTVSDSELSDDIKVLLEELTEQERKIIILRFGFGGKDPLTLGETGDAMGVTRERIRQVQNIALNKLQNSNMRFVLAQYLGMKPDDEGVIDINRPVNLEMIDSKKPIFG